MWFAPLALFLTPQVDQAPAAPAPAPVAAPQLLNARERAIHLLSRLSYAPTPITIAEVERMGISAWLDQQLKPGRMADGRFARRMDELLGVSATPGDAVEWVREPRLEMGYEREDFLPAAMEKLDEEERAERRELAEQLRDEERKRVYQLQFEFLGANLARAVESDRQAEEVLADFWRNHFNVDTRKNRNQAAFWMPSWEREVIRGKMWGDFETMLFATAQHPAMLEYLDQAGSRRAFSEGEIERFRQRELRRGRDPERVEEIIQRRAQGGPNENYARELMELHTLGVDQVYEQADVIAVSEALTGWTFRRLANDPERSFQFVFDPNRHQVGERSLFGEALPSSAKADQDSIGEGEEILRRLAQHDATADFITRKLVRRLAADQEPEVLVEAAKAAWAEHNGDLTEVTRAILLNPAFYDRSLYQSKVKTPWEFVVSSLRVLGAEVHDPRRTLRALAEMGQPLYQCDVPTGWSDAAEDWLDPGAMAYRWSFAEAVASGRMPGVHFSRQVYADWLLGHEPEQWPTALALRIVPAGIGANTQAALQQTMDEYLASRPVQRRGARAIEVAPTLAALLLGCPEFQRQ